MTHGLINYSQLITRSGASGRYNIEKQTSLLCLLHITLIKNKRKVLLSLRGVTLHCFAGELQQD